MFMRLFSLILPLLERDDAGGGSNAPANVRTDVFPIRSAAPTEPDPAADGGGGEAGDDGAAGGNGGGGGDNAADGAGGDGASGEGDGSVDEVDDDDDWGADVELENMRREVDYYRRRDEESRRRQDGDRPPARRDGRRDGERDDEFDRETRGRRDEYDRRGQGGRGTRPPLPDIRGMELSPGEQVIFQAMGDQISYLEGLISERLGGIGERFDSFQEHTRKAEEDRRKIERIVAEDREAGQITDNLIKRHPVLSKNSEVARMVVEDIQEMWKSNRLRIIDIPAAVRSRFQRYKGYVKTRSVPQKGADAAKARAEQLKNSTRGASGGGTPKGAGGQGDGASKKPRTVREITRDNAKKIGV